MKLCDVEYNKTRIMLTGSPFVTLFTRKPLERKFVRAGAQLPSRLPIPTPAPRYHPQHDIANWRIRIPAALHRVPASSSVLRSGKTSWHFGRLRIRPAANPVGHSVLQGS
eukprot:5437508-Pyramimonas_sp.AAC.1